MFQSYLQDQKTRRIHAKQRRIFDYWCRRKARFEDTISSIRCINTALERLMNGSETDRLQIMRRLVQVTSPFCETKIQPLDTVSVVCVIESLLQQHKWSFMTSDFRIAVLLVLANLSTNKQALPSTISDGLVSHIVTQSMEPSFLKQMSSEEISNLVMLINNMAVVKDDTTNVLASNTKCLFVTCLQQLAPHNDFAREVYAKFTVQQKPKQRKLPHAIQDLANAFLSQVPVADAMHKLQVIIFDNTLVPWLDDVRHILNTHVFSTPTHKLFLKRLSPNHTRLFLQSRFLTHVVIDAMSISHPLATSIAELLSEWALVQRQETFQHLACDHETMGVLERNIRGLDQTFQKHIWDKLFYFWNNTFTLFNDANQIASFFIQAMDAYYHIPTRKAETLQVFFSVFLSYTKSS